MCPKGPDPREKYEGKPPYFQLKCNNLKTSNLIMSYNGNKVSLNPNDTLAVIRSNILSLEGLKGSISFEDNSKTKVKILKENELSNRILCDNSTYRIYFHYVYIYYIYYSLFFCYF